MRAAAAQLHADIGARVAASAPDADAASSMRHLEEALARSQAAEGVVGDVPLRPLVHLLSGAMNEAALAMAAVEDPRRELDQTMAVLERLMGTLRPCPR